MTTKAKRAEIMEATEALRGILKPGDRVYTVLRHVSASGMSRCISIKVCRDGTIGTLDGMVARALGYRTSPKHGGCIVTGAGMDMGFHLVYNLGRRLWPDGTPEPHGTRNGQPDRDGGYALIHEWL